MRYPEIEVRFFDLRSMTPMPSSLPAGDATRQGWVAAAIAEALRASRACKGFR